MYYWGLNHGGTNQKNKRFDKKSRSIYINLLSIYFKLTNDMYICT